MSAFYVLPEVDDVVQQTAMAVPDVGAVYQGGE